MKKNLFFLVALCIASSLFISCKKDDDSEVAKPTPQPEVITLDPDSPASIILGEWEPEYIDVKIDNEITTELIEPTENCNKDYLDFKTGGILKSYTYTNDEGGGCIQDVQEETYNLENNYLTFTDAGTTYTTKIIILVNNDLEIEFDINELYTESEIQELGFSEDDYVRVHYAKKY